MTYRSPFISVQKLFLSIVNFDLGECDFRTCSYCLLIGTDRRCSRHLNLSCGIHCMLDAKG